MHVTSRARECRGAHFISEEEGLTMTDYLSLVRERELQDLVENLDAALDALESYATCEDYTRPIKQHDRFCIEHALEAAATFLHELRFAGDSVRASELNR
jgi:hypothetical protein